jgi:hypothetical protein
VRTHCRPLRVLPQSFQAPKVMSQAQEMLEVMLPRRILLAPEQQSMQTLI